ncbi:MAG: spore coat protein CotJB [Oscillospiraceae bacterium]|nr:spore coat protein CotJB [Oscillospiraceae bacterium]
MKRHQMERRGGNGHLPACAPLANPYVPFQNEDPPMYEARKGIIRGTIYPGLDLPFMGMVNRKELNTTPKTELQTLAFAINELALYLDTHRNDIQALKMYRTYQQIYHKCMEEYQRKHGPLNHRTPSEGEYRWLDDPWPWEYCANKEV